MVVLALYGLFVLVWRLRARWIIDTLRRFIRGLFNPAVLRLAGRRHFWSTPRPWE